MHILRKCLEVCFLAALGLAPGARAALAEAHALDPGSVVIQLQIDGPIGPATGDYVLRYLDQAADRHATLVVLRMDTPGGLDTVMRDIIKKIIASPVPVATYVAPGGARAASAGTYILYASHFAAMAPATNLGAATPVEIAFPGAYGDRSKEKPEGGKSGQGQAMERKMTNDAVAYIRGLAKLRGRNADWAEKAVREAASLPAEEALNLKIIDTVAVDGVDLIRKLDGRSVSVLGQTVRLDLSHVHIETIEPDWRSRFLAVIANPNIAYVLLLIGIYGLVIEFYHPGAVVPGTIGGISLLLALYGFQALPVNYAGLGLILLGIGLMIAEAFVPSFGVLGIGGISAFIFGSVILLNTDVPGLELSPVLITLFAISSAVLLLLVSGMVLKARRKPVVSGPEELIGASATALEDFRTHGRIWIHSESWLARTDKPLLKGQQALVKAVDGLTLVVTPLETRKENE
jgi:membrane-bound serine protease (ClpP class)